MASIDEIYNTLPAHYTLSNKNLIITAHVRDEIIYYYDQLGPTTTIILLAQPECYAIKKIFLDFMNDIGTTVIDLREKETFDKNYMMTRKSINVIKRMLMEYEYEKIITHPQYAIDNDPQNRAIYDIVSYILPKLGKDNHYTYNKINSYDRPILPCGIKKEIIKLYSRVVTNNNELDKNIYDNYMNIASTISGIRKISYNS